MIYDTKSRLWLPGRLAGTPRSQRGAIGVMAQRMPMRPISTPAVLPTPDFRFLATSTWLFTDTAGTTNVTTDGQQIACWTDMIAGVKVIAAVTKPLYKTNIGGMAECVQWDGVNSTLTAATIFGSAVATIFAVIRRDGIDGTNGYFVIGGEVAGSTAWRIDANTKMRLIRDNIAGIGTGTADTPNLTWFQVNVSWDRTTGGVFRLSSAADGSCVGANSDWELRRMASDSSGGLSSVYKGQYKDIIIYNGVLSLATKQQAEAYITQTYSVT